MGLHDPEFESYCEPVEQLCLVLPTVFISAKLSVIGIYLQKLIQPVTIHEIIKL